MRPVKNQIHTVIGSDKLRRRRRGSSTAATAVQTMPFSKQNAAERTDSVGGVAVHVRDVQRGPFFAPIVATQRQHKTSKKMANVNIGTPDASAFGGHVNR